MPTKIFTTIDGKCPFGRECQTDSKECRKCENYYRNGTGMFFWCKAATPGLDAPKKKRGRPRKEDVQAKDAAMKAANRGSKPTKGKERPIKAIKQAVK